MPTAILIDGAFFVIRFRAIEPHNAFDAKRAAEVAWRWAVAHLSPPTNGGKGKGQRQELYRIFFYDCPPLEKKMHNPISGRAIDYAKSDEAKFRKDLHSEPGLPQLRTRHHRSRNSVHRQPLAAALFTALRFV